MNNIILNNGIEVPWIGLGTFPMRGQECENAIKTAIKCGYRLFDSATSYRNAEFVGKALKESFLQREDYVLMTKLANYQQRKGNVREALIQSLQYLGVDYIDIYLLHWPNPGTYVECYQQMEELQKEGLIRAIGVSNFHEHHLEELFKYTSVMPVLNQVELHPLLNQTKLVSYCKSKGIKMVSYSPFARMDGRLVLNEVLLGIAKKYDVKVTQIIIRWNYQHGYVVIPKSAKMSRQLENISIDGFVLSEEDMLVIDGCNEDYRVRHNPDTCDFERL